MENYCSCLLWQSLGDKNLFLLAVFFYVWRITLIKLCAWTRRQFWVIKDEKNVCGWILLVLKFFEKSFCCWVWQINKTTPHTLLPPHKWEDILSTFEINIFEYSDFLTFSCVRITKDHHPHTFIISNLNK